MKLLTKALEARLPKLGATEDIPLREKRVICKFFALGTARSWYVLEGERQPDGDVLFFGFVKGLEAELGYFSLRELEKLQMELALGDRSLGTIPLVERDRYFGDHVLGEVLGAIA